MKTAPRSREQGMSLVEVMVGVMIGLIGILIITQAYISSDNFNRSTLGAGSGQTNGLIAMFSIERDAQMAGYGLNQSAALSCGQLYYYYNGNYSSNVPGQAAGTALPTLTLAPVYIDSSVTPNSVTMMFSNGSTRMVPGTIATFNPPNLTVDGTAGFSTGDFVMLVSQSAAGNCTLEQLTDVQAVSSQLQFGSGGGELYNPPAWGTFPTTYATNDLIFDIGNPTVRTYSVAKPAVGQYRLQVTDSLLVTGGGVAQDLVDGVVDLRAQYGKDDGAGGGTAGDGVVDEYNNVQPVSGTDWSQVLSIRVGVLVRIGDYEKPATAGGPCSATTAAPTWAGGSFTVPEGLPSCYRYRVYQTIVPIRNLIWRYS
ncbi:MAG TPA: PilW family protein [Burkholderiales bacterium]|nr:PilW family protein [Burkholderiales bacterium]